MNIPINLEAIKQFLVGTVLPPVAGALATWLASTPVLAVFHITANAAAAEITQLAVFGVTAGLSWLTAHHILLGHYSPAAKATISARAALLTAEADTQRASVSPAQRTGPTPAK